jgi:phenylacetate-CoA ligase
MPMHDRILGRSDDMFIFRAVNIYPSHIDQILSCVEGAGCEYQIVLDRNDDGRDRMLIRLEKEQGVSGKDSNEKISKKVKGDVKTQVMVSCDVEVVEYGALPRSERKTKRVFDNRE